MRPRGMQWPAGQGPQGKWPRAPVPGGGHVTLRIETGHLVKDMRTPLVKDEGFKYQLLVEGSYQS